MTLLQGDDSAVESRQGVSEVMASTLAQLGISHIFTLMGAGNLRLIHHLVVDQGVGIHHLRHENGAIGAADGYARATGEVGWCTVTQGPGFTNTLTALQTANNGRTALVLITTDSSSLSERKFPFAGGVQNIDPTILLEPLGIAVLRLAAETAAADVCAAYELARRESRVVVLVVPAGLDKLPTPSPSADDIARTVDAATAAPTVPAAEDVMRVAEALRGSVSPIFLAGRGAVESGAAGAIARLAELTGAHLAASAKVAGVFHDSPANLGIMGGLSTDEAAAVIDNADCIVAFGATLNFFQTRRSAFLDGKTVIHIDSRESAFTRYDEPHSAVLGDAKLVAQELIEVLTPYQGDRTLPTAPLILPHTDVSAPGALDPRTLCQELDAALPARRIVFVDNGHFGSFPMMHMRHTSPEGLVWMPDFGAVGSALGASIAGALGRPDLQSVLFIGDCGLYMTLGDLELAVRENIPLVVVCMNDGAAGSELRHMSDWGVPPDEAIFGVADIAAVAKGMGAQSAVVAELGQAEVAIQSWDRSRGPLLLDCRISRDVRNPTYDHA